MADSSTVNYNFILPEIGASKDTWGTKLNSNFALLDNLLRTAANELIATPVGSVSGGFYFRFSANGNLDEENL